MDSVNKNLSYSVDSVERLNFQPRTIEKEESLEERQARSANYLTSLNIVEEKKRMEILTEVDDIKSSLVKEETVKNVLAQYAKENTVYGEKIVGKKIGGYLGVLMTGVDLISLNIRTWAHKEANNNSLLSNLTKTSGLNNVFLREKEAQTWRQAEEIKDQLLTKEEEQIIINSELLQRKIDLKDRLSEIDLKTAKTLSNSSEKIDKLISNPHLRNRIKLLKVAGIYALSCSIGLGYRVALGPAGFILGGAATGVINQIIAGKKFDAKEWSKELEQYDLPTRIEIVKLADKKGLLTGSKLAKAKLLTQANQWTLEEQEKEKNIPLYKENKDKKTIDTQKILNKKRWDNLKNIGKGGAIGGTVGLLMFGANKLYDLAANFDYHKTLEVMQNIHFAEPANASELKNIDWSHFKNKEIYKLAQSHGQLNQLEILAKNTAANNPGYSSPEDVLNKLNSNRDDLKHLENIFNHQYNGSDVMKDKLSAIYKNFPSLNDSSINGFNGNSGFNQGRQIHDLLKLAQTDPDGAKIIADLHNVDIKNLAQEIHNNNFDVDKKELIKAWDYKQWFKDATNSKKTADLQNEINDLKKYLAGFVSFPAPTATPHPTNTPVPTFTPTAKPTLTSIPTPIPSSTPTVFEQITPTAVPTEIASKGDDWWSSFNKWGDRNKNTVIGFTIGIPSAILIGFGIWFGLNTMKKTSTPVKNGEPFGPTFPHEDPAVTAAREIAERARKKAKEAAKKKASPLADEKKASPLADEKKASPLADEKKASPLADEKKASPLADEKKASPLADEKKASPLADEKKASPLADEHGDMGKGFSF